MRTDEDQAKWSWNGGFMAGLVLSYLLYVLLPFLKTKLLQ
jgi:hypothetical protein